MNETTTLTAKELALYLGCEIDCNGQIETLDSVCFQDGTCETLFRGNMRNLRELEEIKPILRPLSDMTMGEMKELYSVVFNREFVGNNITHRDIGNKSERWVLWSGVERLFIYKDGDIGADSDLSHYRVPAPTVLMWQLSNGFDIFNWIEQGKAIDKTKTK